MSETLLPWHKPLLQQWAGGNHHAWLLVGHAGAGLGALARAQAQAWLCDAPVAGVACLRCVACSWWAAGTHPDYLEVTADPEGDDPDDGDGATAAATASEGKAKPVARREIKIGAVRDLGAWAATSAHRHRKVIVMDPADAMNLAAASAFLKLLEEPPPAVRFVLTASDRRRMPATIVSRCLARVVPLPETAAAVEWLSQQSELKTVPAAQIAHVLSQACGAPQAAIAFADPQYQAARRAFLEALATPAQLSALLQGDILESVKKEQRREALGMRLDLLIAWICDINVVRVGGVPRFNPDFQPFIEKLAKPLPAVQFFWYYAKLIDRKRNLQHPLSPRLVLEDLLIQYKSIAA